MNFFKCSDGLIGLEVNNYRIPNDNSKVIIGKALNVGVKNVHKNTQFMVCPNPVNERVNVKLDEFYGEIALSLNTVLGQKVANYQLANQNSFSLPLDLPSGVYFMNIIGDHMNLGTVKIIHENGAK